MKKNNFLIFKNYIKIYKSKGMRMVIEYFLFNHFFDIYYGTDTHFLGT